MATIVLNDAFLSFGTSITSMSADMTNVSLSYSAETHDDTVFTDDTRSFKGGLKNWSVSATVLQNFAASQIDSKLFSLVGTTAALAFRSSTAAKGGSNPEFGGTALLDTYEIVGTAVGELTKAQISFKSAGTLTRATS